MIAKLGLIKDVIKIIALKLKKKFTKQEKRKFLKLEILCFY